MRTFLWVIFKYQNHEMYFHYKFAWFVFCLKISKDGAGRVLFSFYVWCSICKYCIICDWRWQRRQDQSGQQDTVNIMVFILDGCSFHVAHEWWKQGLFLLRPFRCNQMPSTNRNAWFTPCVRIMKWTTI